MATPLLPPLVLKLCLCSSLVGERMDPCKLSKLAFTASQTSHILWKAEMSTKLVEQTKLEIEQEQEQ